MKLVFILLTITYANNNYDYFTYEAYSDYFDGKVANAIETNKLFFVALNGEDSKTVTPVQYFRRNNGQAGLMKRNKKSFGELINWLKPRVSARFSRFSANALRCARFSIHAL